MMLDLPIAADLRPIARADHDGSTMRPTSWELWLARCDAWLVWLRAYDADNADMRERIAKGRDDR
jgi:hypothetical protein